MHRVGSSSVLILHSDNGGPMKGCTMLAMLQQLGITPSFSRPSVSNDNPFSESLFKTTKYCPMYPKKPFESLEAAQIWVVSFVQWYNNKHCHSGIRFVTPQIKHDGLEEMVLAARHEIYQQAKLSNPRRWSKKTRNWSPVSEVHLNPGRTKKTASPLLVQEFAGVRGRASSNLAAAGNLIEKESDCFVAHPLVRRLIRCAI